MKLRLTSGEVIPLKRDETIFHALKSAGIYLVAPCGAKGACGKCKVRILEGDYHTSGHAGLSPEELSSGIVLACATQPEGDLLAEIPKESLLVMGDRISVSETKNLAALLATYGTGADPLTNAAISKLPDKDGLFGLAIDIGTTTVVAYLAELASGKIRDVGSAYNAQIRFGDDVITRIVHATEGGGLQELRDAVVADINAIITAITERHDISPSRIAAATITANTVMSHMFWGLDTASIREEPYIPLMTSFPEKTAYEALLGINQEAPVYTAPCIASYVGGDIVAGVLASKMHRQDEIALFMDIGTNGEIVIGNREWLLTAACSAGPCFEGSGIKCGMRATPGAIEAVRIDRNTFETSVSVIGESAAVGICGSGMIDAISEMFLAGLIDRKGRLATGKSPAIRQGDDGLEFVIYSDRRSKREIVLTEVDIENIIRSKAAIYAGISTLLSGAGLTIDAVQKIYIAGGFGNYLNPEKAIMLGMLPDLPADRFTFLGNSSVTGAYLLLMSGRLRTEAEEIASKMTYIDLSASGMFMDEYMSALFLPHTDIKLFPSVDRLL